MRIRAAILVTHGETYTAVMVSSVQGFVCAVCVVSLEL